MIDFQTEREKWIWLAGIIDAEGCLTLKKIKRPTNLNRIGYQPTLDIDSTTPLFLQQIKSAFNNNGSISNGHKQKGNRKPTFHLNLSSNALRKFLPKIKPFLILKRHQVELVLEVLNILKDNHTKAGKYKEKYKDDVNRNFMRLEEIYKEIGKLNKRGVN